MFAQADAAGRRIVAMIDEGLTARKMLTPASVSNAMAVALAASGSGNCVRHLQAIALEAELDVSLYDILDAMGPRIPLLCAVRPNGSARIEDLDRAGGVRAIMKRLGDRIDGSAMTVSGKTWAEELTNYDPPDDPVLADPERPLSDLPALVTLRGSLAPDGALLKLGTGGVEKLLFEGPARCFDSQEEAIDGLGAGRIRPGDVVVLRHLGPRGGPGVASASWFVAALNGAGLAGRVAVVTDGQLSGLNHGLVINQVSPEAYLGGPIALVEDGDLIVIDVLSRRLDVSVVETELDIRSKQLVMPQPLDERGWLSVYRRLAGPIHRGATLKE
jgi:dihydroxy-acid dehydratase